MISLFIALSLHAQLDHSALGNSLVGTNVGTMTADRIRMTQYQVTEGGFVNTLMVYVVPGTSQKIRGVIYDSMKRLLGFTGETTIDESMPAQWIRLRTHQPIQFEKNSLIYLGIISGPAVTPAKFKFTPGGGGRVIVTTEYSDGPPQSISRVDTVLDGYLSVYVIVYNGICPNGTCLSATWQASSSSNIARYELGYSKTSGSYDKFLQTTNLSTTISGLDPNTNYCVAVRAIDTNNSVSPWSNEICRNTLSVIGTTLDLRLN